MAYEEPDLPVSGTAVGTSAFGFKVRNSLIDHEARMLALESSAGMTLIDEHIVASDAEYLVEFSSIPATYRNLVVVFNGRIVDSSSGTNGNVNFRCNDDSGASNYRLSGFNVDLDASPSAYIACSTPADDSKGKIMLGNLPTQNSASPYSANYAFNAKLEIFNYRSVFYKNLIGECHGFSSNSDGDNSLSKYSNIWKSTDAITKLAFSSTSSFAAGGDCFKTGTYFGLYGMA
jgi:hypothetical protein